MLLVLAYILNNRYFDPKFGGDLEIISCPYHVVPYYWLYIHYPAGQKAWKIAHEQNPGWLALMCAFISMLGMMLQGAIGGFGKSPYNHSWVGL
jgi:hypothetical protein